MQKAGKLLVCIAVLSLLTGMGADGVSVSGGTTAASWDTVKPLPFPTLVALLCEGEISAETDPAWRVTAAFCSMELRSVTLQDADGRLHAVDVLTATDDRQRAAGFQHVGRETMRRAGILFQFSEQMTGSFHMCNVEESIWIAWLTAAGRVVDVQHMEPGAAVSPAQCRDLYGPRLGSSYQFALELGEDVVRALGGPDALEGDARLFVEPWMFGQDRFKIALEPVYRGLREPLQIIFLPGDRDVAWIVEKIGRIRVAIDGHVQPGAVLDIQDTVSRGFEQGLLSVALHPDFPINRTFFVNYTDRAGDTRIVRYTMQAETYRADVDSARRVMDIPQPASNHNGGLMEFGSDGYLYIATGDGGRGGDPWNHGQSLDTLLGKLLRIDVDGGDPYGIPADNPFVGQTGVREEIWAYGLRNPWRFSFDPETDDLFIADVGQERWEEVNYVPAGTGGGFNFGWNSMEGLACYVSGCSDEGLILPAVVYGHDDKGGCSITGGHVYRGMDIPFLDGAYVFGDYCTGRIWATWPHRSDGEGPWPMTELLQAPIRLSSFGLDHRGELYATDLAQGTVYRLVPAP